MSLILKGVDEYLSELKASKKPRAKATKQRLYTSISGGKFKGKKLVLPSLQTTRSTKSIVRQSFLNVVRQRLVDCCFIEGFGGSGLMACEAISAGARRAIAIEKDQEAYKIASQNASSLNEISIEVLKGDSLELMPSIVEKSSLKVILYLDPPFDIREGFGGIYERLMRLIAGLNKDKIELICFEHNSSFEMPQAIDEFRLVKQKKFGQTSLSYYEL